MALLGIKNAPANYVCLIPKARTILKEKTPAKIRNKTRMANIIITI